MEKIKIFGISIWRIFAYFVIYSFLGYLVETLYALVLYGVVESRQSFLYGPFCSIYGLGAVIMICSLQKVKENKHALFFCGMIVGCITEYLVSLIGELLFHTRWWDYSNNFLNINGRISLIYGIIWGFLALYLLSVLNPKIDEFLDWLKTKINYKILKIIISFATLFLFVDCILSGLALDFYLVRIIGENDLDVDYKESISTQYEYLYVENENISKTIYQFWGNEKMVKTYPNVTISLKNGQNVFAKDYLPEIQPYYYKFNRDKYREVKDENI